MRWQCIIITGRRHSFASSVLPKQLVVMYIIMSNCGCICHRPLPQQQERWSMLLRWKAVCDVWVHTHELGCCRIFLVQKGVLSQAQTLNPKHLRSTCTERVLSQAPTLNTETFPYKRRPLEKTNPTATMAVCKGLTRCEQGQHLVVHRI